MSKWSLFTNSATWWHSLFNTFQCPLVGFPGGSVGKASAYNAGDRGSIPGSERSPGEGNGQPTPVGLPGKSHARRSLVWGHKDSDTTKRLSLHFSVNISGGWPVPLGEQSVIIQSVQSLTVFKIAPVIYNLARMCSSPSSWLEAGLAANILKFQEWH